MPFSLEQAASLDVSDLTHAIRLYMANLMHFVDLGPENNKYAITQATLSLVPYWLESNRPEGHLVLYHVAYPNQIEDITRNGLYHEREPTLSASLVGALAYAIKKAGVLLRYELDNKDVFFVAVDQCGPGYLPSRQLSSEEKPSHKIPKDFIRDKIFWLDPALCKPVEVFRYQTEMLYAIDEMIQLRLFSEIGPIEFLDAIGQDGFSHHEFFLNLGKGGRRRTLHSDHCPVYLDAKGSHGNVLPRYHIGDIIDYPDQINLIKKCGLCCDF